MKKSLLFLVTIFNSLLSLSQPSIQWQHSFGGTGADQVSSIIPTADGGYALFGYSISHNGNVAGNHGSYDYWLVKTDSTGILQWEKSYGGTGDDKGYSILQTTDGGYIMAGYTTSTNGDVTGNHGTYDAWVIKTDASGVLMWQKCYGGSGSDGATSMASLSNGNFILYAQSNSTNGDVSGNHGGQDIWVFQIDAVGAIQWQKSYGGSGTDGGQGFLQGRVIYPTNDGGCLITSSSCSNDGDVSGHHTGAGWPVDSDFWIVKIDHAGTIQWQKSLGGTQFERGLSGYQEASGNYIVSGISASSDGNVTGHVQNPNNSSPSNHYNEWVVKLNSSGNIVWEKGLGLGYGWHSAPTIEGGSITSQSGKLVKLDASGNVQWKKSNLPLTSYFFQKADSSFITAGFNAPIALRDYIITKLSAVPTNVIVGNVYQDLNRNCVKDTNEVGLPGKIIVASPGNYFATTDANGDYTIFIDPGTYTVSQASTEYYNQSCPVALGTYSVTISALAPSSYTNNFADTLTVNCPDLTINVAAPFFRRCFKNNVSVFYGNIGSTSATNAVVNMTFDNLIIPLSSSIPWVKNGNVYTFSIGTIQPGIFGSFFITDSVDCTASLSGLNSVCVSASINTSSAECSLLNNTKNDCHYIVGSCDPNAKEVASQNKTNKGYIAIENITGTDTLTYMIRFQNIGNDTAFTVVVRDTLSSYLNPSTVQMLAASNPYTFRIFGHGILEWTFDNIKLTDSTSNELKSHGFLKFQILQKLGNGVGTIIKNTAAIWFDYNNPMLTNHTTNTIPLTTAASLINDRNNTFVVYPNPSSNTITIVGNTLENESYTFTIKNLLGETVFFEPKIVGNNVIEKTVSIEHFSAGIYFLSIDSDKNISTIKIIKQ